ncbi:MAG: class I SAM-dependent methyltransferase [Pseudomonadota bacterium]
MPPKFDTVTETFGDLPYMKAPQAEILRKIITECDISDVLEVGFFQGKSSAYIAAMLEDLGRGHLTTIDRAAARERAPNIETVLDRLDLSARVTPIYAHRSYTWELQRLIAQNPRPQFDLCYFDGGHHWDGTGFGALLVDMLLRPGGVLILDDMDWSIASSRAYKGKPGRMEQYSADEREAKTVRLVWDTILPHLGYRKVKVLKGLKWGVARKVPPKGQGGGGGNLRKLLRDADAQPTDTAPDPSNTDTTATA